MGHSYGGSLVTFAGFPGALSPRPAALIDFSGAVLSWASSDHWSDALSLAAATHGSPILFFMTLNESSSLTFAPSVVPWIYASGSGFGEARLNLYDPVPLAEMLNCRVTSSTFECAHGRFLHRLSQIDRWGPDVVDFLNDHGIE